MTDTRWDLVVVGAGPAGAVAALAAMVADPDAKVLLMDRAAFPRDKCCGDGIAPHVLDVLGPLGAADVVAAWTPLHRLELSRSRRTVRGHLARPVWVIPRRVFDALLVARAVIAGARLVHHRVREVRVDAEGVLVDRRYRARTLVAADGVRSTVRHSLGRPPPRRRAIAVRGYAPTAADRAGAQVIRYADGHAQPSYAWAFDRGDGLSNVGYGELVADQQHTSRRHLVERLEALLPGATADAGQWRGHHLPLSGWGWGKSEQPDGPVLYAGDAAGLVNPMTGEGIYYAVATGALAGRTAITAVRRDRPPLAGHQHRRAVRHLLEEHLHHTWLASRLTRHAAVVDAGIAAAAADQRTFDDLVELGLGDGRLTPRLVGSLAAGLARRRRSPLQES